MRLNVYSFLIWIAILVTIFSSTLWHYQPLVDPVVINHDPRIAVLAQFMANHHFNAELRPKDFLDCSDESKIDWRILPIIAFKESSGGRRFTDGTNNIMGIVFTGPDGKDYLYSFPSIKASICKSGNLIASYTATTLAGKIATYNSHEEYYQSFMQLYAQLK